MQTLLFYRNYNFFTGGHLKVWDYFEHVRHSSSYVPQIYFLPTSLWDQSNPWLGIKDSVLPSWDSDKADVVFMEGTDWREVNWQGIDAAKPIINLIQHVRHANPENVRYPFLVNKAIRICVSAEVAACLHETKKVNGPIYTIPLGLDASQLPMPLPQDERDIEVFVTGMKNPMVTQAVSNALDGLGIKHELLLERIPRQDFLDKLGRAKIAVLVPNGEGEGFYMPPLEAMAAKTLVVCPDCIGNRSFCLDGINCFRPSNQSEAIVQATLRAMALSEAEAEEFREAGLKTVAEYNLLDERREFLKILENVEQIW